jgi:AraC-like DNA-binding protein
MVKNAGSIQEHLNAFKQTFGASPHRYITGQRMVQNLLLVNPAAPATK